MAKENKFSMRMRTVESHIKAITITFCVSDNQIDFFENDFAFAFIRAK